MLFPPTLHGDAVDFGVVLGFPAGLGGDGPTKDGPDPSRAGMLRESAARCSNEV
jgi:hypothetical protein